MPVGQMGNYQEYLKRMPTPLREIESAPVRQHMFGNPFKLDKRMMIDEADIDLIGGASSKSRNKQQEAIMINPGGMSPTQVPVSSINNAIRAGVTVAGIGVGMKRKAGPIPREFVFTPYKNRRRNLSSSSSTSSIIDEDSSSDGYFNSTPSSPNPYASPAGPLPSESPLYDYPDPPVITPLSDGRPLPVLVDDLTSNSYNMSESFNSLEKLIETSTQSLPFVHPKPILSSGATNGIGQTNSNFLSITNKSHLPLEDIVVMSSSNNNKSIVAAENHHNNDSFLPNHKGLVNNSHSSEITRFTNAGRPILDNWIGSSTPPTTISASNNHLSHDQTPPQITISSKVNHKSGKSKKTVDGGTANHVKTEKAPVEQKEVPPADDENTRRKNLDLRDELFSEIRRPILSKRKQYVFFDHIYWPRNLERF